MIHERVIRTAAYALIAVVIAAPIGAGLAILIDGGPLAAFAFGGLIGWGLGPLAIYLAEKHTRAA